ncbi:hypothetical protein GOP47_0016477 [Adiantum capillus-veneris]|uniref:GTD-binding domain-containing protein n=1 Tax=Adiantum capillus-veneris TaxID=13818 RepID=A0A9D4UI56_ADICA|nr:hypothetical protein GOP47_0016477 [Adiantum capillus-veneris]
MINFRSLGKRFHSIHYIPCIIIPSSVMALSKAQITTDEDPWKVSSFVSAIAELSLSILLLLGAGIAYFTSRIVKFLGLEPPCTYIGCSHPLHLHSEGNHESNILGPKDHAVMETGTDGCVAHLGQGKEDQCSCNDNLPCKRQSPSKLLRCHGTIRAQSNGSLNEGYPALLSARSNAKSIGESSAKDHCEILQVPVNSEQQGTSEATSMKGAGNECAGSDSILRKRRGRSKRPRRRDLAHARSIGKSTFLSAGSNPESNAGFNAGNHAEIMAEEGECNEANTKAEDFPIHNIASVQHSEPAKGLIVLVEDAIEVGNMVATTNTDVDRALPSARSCPESRGGFVAENHCEIFQVSAHSEQQGQCEETDIRNEDSSDHDMVLVHRSVVFDGHAAVDEANTAHASKGEETADAETLECLKKHANVTSMSITEHAYTHLLPCEDMVDVCKTEHFSLLPDEDNQCIIQFGSIIARTCIENGITNNTCVDSGRIGNREIVNRVKIDIDSLQEKGRIENSTDLKNVFGDVIAVRQSLDELTPRNDVTIFTKESFSAEVIEGTCTSVEEQAPLTMPLDDVGDDEEANAEEEQEEGLDALKMALQAERSMLVELETELENERNAAAVATNEAMAMISRLQEEKSAMQMEVAQLQRMSEERADYDEQAMAVLKEILFKRETENMVLEKEIELYRHSLLAGSAGEPNDVWLKEAGALALQSPCRPLLSIGQDMGLRSPLGAAAPWISQSEPSMDSEELNRVSDWQNSNKRSRDFPARSLGFPSEQFDGINHIEGGFYGRHDTYQHVKKMSKCSSFTDDETLSARESPWVLTKELPGEEEFKRKPWMIHEDQQSGKKRATSSLTESCGAQSKCGTRSENRGEVEGGCGVFVPIHDVYEVHTTSTRSPPRVEERDPLEVFDSASTTNKELKPSMSRHITEFPPRFVPTTKLLASDEILSTPTSLVQTAGWDVEKSFHTEDLCERHDLRSLSLVSREERRAEMEEIKQLAVRLKVLEEDRDLLRETVESVKHRDAGLSLLQEISKHLLELRIGGFTGVSEGALSEETSITSPSRMRPQKKRRYYSSLGQAQTLLQHQKSVACIILIEF